MTTSDHSPNKAGVPAPTQLTGRMVLICLLIFFGVVAGINAVMIVAATSTFSGAETTSAYEAGTAFARELAEARAQEALHWNVVANITPGDHGARLVEILARDATGAPLTDLRVSARLGHPADERLDRAVALSERAPGRFVGPVEASAGQWDLVIELARDGKRVFRSNNRITLR